MKIINTDGMALIGPGSEWFWTALSGMVLAVTFIAIYRQLSIARSANAFAQLDAIQRESDSERMTRAKLEVLLAMREAEDPADLPESAAMTIADFWEKVGVLSRGGHLDLATVHGQIGHLCQLWWAALAPFIREIRLEGEGQWAKAAENFEWLVRVFDTLDRRHGPPVVFDGAYFAANHLDRMIAGCQDDLRVWESLRAVIFKSAETGPDIEPVPPPA